MANGGSGDEKDRARRAAADGHLEDKLFGNTRWYDHFGRADDVEAVLEEMPVQVCQERPRIGLARIELDGLHPAGGKAVDGDLRDEDLSPKGRVGEVEPDRHRLFGGAEHPGPVAREINTEREGPTAKALGGRSEILAVGIEGLGDDAGLDAPGGDGELVHTFVSFFRAFSRIRQS